MYILNPVNGYYNSTNKTLFSICITINILLYYVYIVLLFVLVKVLMLYYNSNIL